MPTSHTLTGDLSDVVGTDFPPRSVWVTIKTNLGDNVVLDSSGNQVRLPRHRFALATNGLFSKSLWSTAALTNPSGYQYGVEVEWPDGPGGTAKKKWFSGWFSLTADKDLADIDYDPFIPPEYYPELRVARDEAVAAAEDAEESRVAAEEARAGAEAVGTTNDAIIASRINDPASATASALTASIIDTALTRTVAAPLDLLSVPVHYGRVIRPNSAAWNAGLVESPHVGFDPLTGRLAMTFTGYDAGLTTGVGALAYSDDGVTWTTPAVALEGSGTTGAPDEYGVTGFVWLYDYDAQHFEVFYIGLDSDGYEAATGTPRLCRATTTDLSNPAAYTRHGAIISPSGAGDWMHRKMWHACPIEVNGKRYILINATGIHPDDGRDYERSGAFVSTSGTWAGPWVEVEDDSGNSINPIWDPVQFRDSNLFMTDPSAVIRNGIVTVVGAATELDPLGYGAIGDVAYSCPVETFPFGPWTYHGFVSGDLAGTTFEADTTPFKPWIMEWRGQLLHYGTNNGLVLDASAPIPGVAIYDRTASTAADANATITTTYLQPLDDANPGYHWDLTLQGVRPGDVVEVGVGYALNNVATDVRFDVGIRNPVDNTLIRYASGKGPTGAGFMSMGKVGGGANFQTAGGTDTFIVQASDIIRGRLTLRPVFKVDSGTRTLLNTTTAMVEFRARVVN